MHVHSLRLLLDLEMGCKFRRQALLSLHEHLLVFNILLLPSEVLTLRVDGLAQLELLLDEQVEVTLALVDHMLVLEHD